MISRVFVFLVAMATVVLADDSLTTGERPLVAGKKVGRLVISKIRNDGEDGDPEPYLLLEKDFQAVKKHDHFWRWGKPYTDAGSTWVCDCPSEIETGGPRTSRSITTNRFYIGDEVHLLEADLLNGDDLLGRFTVEEGEFEIRGEDGTAHVVVEVLS